MPNVDESHYLGLITVTDREQCLGILDDAPDSGPFNKGDLIRYRCSPDFEFPLIIAGYGPSGLVDPKS